jgi:hypothetical protein
MKLALLFLACLVAFNNAGMHPFNNVCFMNRTLLQEYIEERKALEGSSGWTMFLFPESPIEPWPVKDGLITVLYCYRSTTTRNFLYQRLEIAILPWNAKLKEPSKDNSHKLAGFKELEDERTCRDDKGDWRSNVPGDTLEIYSARQADGSSHSPVGYVPDSTDKELGRYPIALYHQAGSSLAE